MDELLQQLINGLSWGAIYALIAVGYTMVYGVLRLINFAHGEVYMVGAMAAFYLAAWLKMPLDAARAAPWIWGVVGVLLLLGLGLLAYRALRNRERPVIILEPASSYWLVVPMLAGGMLLTVGQFAWPGQTAVWFGFVTLLGAAMLASATLGFLIEMFAYRPLRSQPRINALITAIGVSLLLQYGGQRVFGPDPKSFPSEAVPRFLPGLSREDPFVAYPWKLHEQKSFDPKGYPEQGRVRVDLIGSAVRIWWVVPESPRSAPATQTAVTPVSETRPTATLADSRPVATVATSPATAPVATVSLAATSPRMVEREVTIGANLMVMLVLTLGLMLLLRHIVLHTRTGLALRAVSHRFDTAALMGVNINRTISFTFVLGSALAGAAGVVVAATYPKIDPLMGFNAGLKAFVAAVLGGIGNIPGAVLGGVLLGLVETLVSAYLPHGSQYRDAIAFAILIVVLLAKPSGLLGKNSVEKV